MSEQLLDRDALVAKLENYVAQFGDEPEQGSPEWLLARRYFIGGSEIAAVLGLNRFKTTMQFYKEKMGVSSFSGNFATRWGSMFEVLTQDLFREIFLREEHRDNLYEIGGIKTST